MLANTPIRLESAKQALETIDKHKDFVEKWDSKLFGKAKFQEEHRLEKWKHDSAVIRLKDLGVKDKFDLRNQERSHECSLKEVHPKLEVEKVQIKPVLNVIQGALQALEGAIRAERYQLAQGNNQSLQKPLKTSIERMKWIIVCNICYNVISAEHKSFGAISGA